MQTNQSLFTLFSATLCNTFSNFDQTAEHFGYRVHIFVFSNRIEIQFINPKHNLVDLSVSHYRALLPFSLKTHVCLFIVFHSFTHSSSILSVM